MKTTNQSTFEFHVIKWDNEGMNMLERYVIKVKRVHLTSAKNWVCTKYPKIKGYFVELNTIY